MCPFTALRVTVARARKDSPVRVAPDRDGPTIRFKVVGHGVAPVTVRWAAAVRILQAHGGTVDRTSGSFSVTLPITGVR